MKRRRRNPHAVALGRLGARKGGRARAQSLTPERRSEIARLAARTRWERHRWQKRRYAAEPVS